MCNTSRFSIPNTVDEYTFVEMDDIHNDVIGQYRNEVCSSIVN